jgi:hypothetical protein
MLRHSTLFVSVDKVMLNKAHVLRLGLLSPCVITSYWRHWVVSGPCCGFVYLLLTHQGYSRVVIIELGNMTD